jgi:hypothetical protein
MTAPVPSRPGSGTYDQVGTLILDKQRELFRRWRTSRGTHPHEALLGILALARDRHPGDAQSARRMRPSAYAPARSSPQ